MDAKTEKLVNDLNTVTRALNQIAKAANDAGISVDVITYGNPDRFTFILKKVDVVFEAAVDGKGA